MFKVGEDVVYLPIDGEGTAQADIDWIESQIGKIKWPIENSCYAVRGYNNDNALLLQEIVHPHMDFGGGNFDEIGFYPSDFVKLDTLSKGLIEETTEILENYNVGVYKMFP